MKKTRISLLICTGLAIFATLFFSSDCYNMTADAATVSENKKAVQSLESDLKSIQNSLASIKSNIDKAKNAQKNELYIKSQLDQEIIFTEGRHLHRPGQGSR